ncbi:MAG: hypothetical protein IKI09_03545 [Bacteroidales bacterium]|nr:hypothetical protein [Bacteroidales bacterium]
MLKLLYDRLFVRLLGECGRTFGAVPSSSPTVSSDCAELNSRSLFGRLSAVSLSDAGCVTVELPSVCCTERTSSETPPRSSVHNTENMPIRCRIAFFV